MTINESHILSDSDVLGNFNFITYNIFILSDDTDFIKKTRNNPDILSFQESVELFSVMVHEYRHYYDMSHSVYGFNYLFSLQDALTQSIDAKSGDEYNFFKIKNFTNNLKKIRYPKYYNVLFKRDDSKKWELRPTIGKAFDSNGRVSDLPILFARYYDTSGQLLCRHPFSMVSLLECSATLDEHINSIELISKELKGQPANKKLLEEKFSKKTIDYIYDITLTEYSTCFHLIANHFSISELQDLFTVTRILLDICLNFTDSHFELIQSNNLVDKLYRPHTGLSAQQLRDYIDFQTGLKFGISHKERPILFYVLLHLMDKRSYVNQESIFLELDSILGGCNLSIIKIFEDARSLILDQTDIIKNSKINYFSLIAQSVKSNLITLEEINGKNIEEYFGHINKFLGELDLPNVQIGESFHRLGKPKESFFDCVSYADNFKEIEKLQKWIDEFDEACLN